jgi:hypothetical protein
VVRVAGAPRVAGEHRVIPAVMDNPFKPQLAFL